MKKNRLVLFIIISLLLIPPTAFAQTLPIPPEYLGIIQQRINPYLIYPPEAIMKNWEGLVKICFILETNGNAKNPQITQSSGYPILDNLVLAAIQKAGPYPLPNNLPKKELEITLPVNFVKKDKPGGTLKPKQLLPVPLKKEAPAITLEPIKLSPAPLPPEILKLTRNIPAELNQYFQIALENNKPAQLAKEEIELAQIKFLEANRNFFPGLKFQLYDGTGEVYDLKFKESEIKASMQQPIFYSGRLRDTFNQVKVNLKITEANYSRLKLDVIHKTEVAYYNLLAAKLHLEQKESLATETKDMLDKITKLYDIGMLIPLELTGAKNWFKQIQFNIENIKQEVSMAELSFKQALNTEEAPQMKGGKLEVKLKEISLDKSLEMALKYRPELPLSRLMEKFNAYGKKIENEKSNFAVDFISSYGYYRGAYINEPMQVSNNWYAGIKVSKPFGASTASGSYISDAAQPRFGQASATKNNSANLEFNLLDNFGRLADRKKAEIELHRSLSDSQETIKTIVFEVKDAYLNYRKNLSLLDTTETEMQYRRQEINVGKIRAMVGEINFSAVMEMLYNFSESQSKYIQALANYNISIANLKKACGYGIEM